MSLQGDVAGIGLAELLQSLTRSEREGVLMLEAPGHQVRIGLRDGQLVLLAAPDEHPEQWDVRSRRAWGEEQPMAVRERRAQDIARAERIEALYRMLDAPQLHFRFSPGPIAAILGLSAELARVSGNQLFGPGYTPEYLLLEHARLLDEITGKRELLPCDVAIACKPAAGSKAKLLAQCDGRSTLSEIADRLGWPLRQLRAAVNEGLASGELRLADPQEQFAIAVTEMEALHAERAAVRIEGWIKRSTGGPLAPLALDALLTAWASGKLAPVLTVLETRSARALLRRIDASLEDPAGALERWETLREARRADAPTMLRCMAWRSSNGPAAAESALPELMRLSALMRERGTPWRAQPMLRLAAAQTPSALATRLELGTQMIEAGLAEEGARWVLEAAHQLIEERDLPRALVSLRGLLKAHPNHKEAQGLLLQASSLAMRRKRRRMHGAIAGALLVIGTAAAMVQVQRESRLRERLEQIVEDEPDPERALALLESEYPNDSRQPVLELRGALHRKHIDAEQLRRQNWTTRYEAVRDECADGDPLAGLEQIASIPPPPQLDIEVPEWPSRTALYGVLARRMDGLLPSASSSDADAQRESDRLEALIDELEDRLGRSVTDGSAQSLADSLRSLRRRLEADRAERAEARRQRIDSNRTREQDRLLELARSHAAALDFDSAVQTYESLIQLSAPESLSQLQLEFEATRRHRDAWLRAEELAQKGQHTQALAALREGCTNPKEHALPWKLDSVPSGARVHFPDGTSRLTPFTVRSAQGERIQLTLELEGYESRTLELRDPADQELHLFVAPERNWATNGAVEALPVPAGDDCIVASRAGDIARVGAQGVEWSHHLPSLGGVARTPLFLPGRPGWLLVLCEDGLAFAVEAQNGKIEGPRALGSPPAIGLSTVRSGIAAQLVDGRFALWTSSVEPQIHATERLYVDSVGGADVPAPASSSFSLLGRSAQSATQIASPWTGRLARVLDGEYEISDPRSKAPVAYVRRSGTWRYLAWEAPHAFCPEGRLWVSDEAGLRCVRPPPTPVAAATPAAATH